MSEVWPDHARGKGGGLLQSGAGIRSFLASGVWLLIGDMGPSAWRYMYVIGVLPALLVFWLRRSMPESSRWEEANERRRLVRAQRRSGVAFDGVDAVLTRSTVVDSVLGLVRLCGSAQPRRVYPYLICHIIHFADRGINVG